jgi:hypothetical protein
VLDLEEPDMGWVKEIQEPLVRRMLLEEGTPLELPPKVRHRAFVGEQVAFFNQPNNNERYRRSDGYQLEVAHVAFDLRMDGTRDLEFALTPVSSRIQYMGAGVFSRGGELLGVIKDLILADDEAGRRPIITSFMGIKDSDFPHMLYKKANEARKSKEAGTSRPS